MTLSFLRPLFGSLLVAAAALVANAADRPNVVWITTEDMSPNLGCYGDPDARTPNLDRLASRSVRYTRAFAVAGVCAPSRSTLISGRYASTIGSQHMRSLATLPPELKILPQILRERGYYTTNNFKEDYNFETPPDAWDASARDAHWRNRGSGQPFFSVFNLMVTHESRLRFDDEAYARLTQRLTPDQRQDPARVTLPSWLPDDPAVRREWARYLELISAADHRVGDLLRELEEAGLSEDTIVIFFSDHGAGLPRAKQFIYEAGLHVPLLVHVPEKWRHRVPASPGTTDDRLVSLVDLAPTVLSMVDLPVPSTMQGKAFLGPATTAPRSHVYAIRDRMDERIDMNRTVSDGRFKYHRNYLPHLPHFPWLDYMDLLETSKAFRRLAADKALPPGLAAFMAGRKPLEELYDLSTDPDELNNLSADHAHAPVLKRLREEHFDWVRRTRDTGFIPEQMLRELSQDSEYNYGQSDAYLIDRCIATVRLVERGASAVPDLRRALKDPYPPVRFWAATGLATLGREAAPAAQDLQAALTDQFAEVAIAAAEALSYLGQPGPGLPVLERSLSSEAPVVRLAAANVIDRIDEEARPILPAIRRAAAEQRGPESPANLFLMVQWTLARALRELDAAQAPTPAAVGGSASESAATGQEGPLVPVGVARVDITPQAPVRLHGFPRGERAVSVSEVAQRIFAKAMAIGSGEETVLLVTTDLLGVSDKMAEELMARLKNESDFSDRSRLAFTASHNHSAPALESVAPYVFRQEPTADQSAEIRAYGEWLMERLVEVAKEALATRRPARLSYAIGTADFGMHRRLLKEGRVVGFGDNPEGDVDHDLPVLAVRDADGALRAVWFSYACHGVCWQRPSVHGDWMGVAQAEIETRNPGALALVTIGCAGDINPKDIYFRGQDPLTPGRQAAAVVQEVLAAPMRPLHGAPESKLVRFELPLQKPAGAAYWERHDNMFARSQLERLKRGETLDDSIPYVVQTWLFGHDLAMVFLAGEVFSGYGLRLKEELDAGRIWVNAYSNDSPAYIPTAEALPQGGWEVDGSRFNYGVPARLDPTAEDILLREVFALIPPEFQRKPEGGDAWWSHTGHPKGKWWLSYPGYEGDAADKIWETVPIPPSPVLSPEDALGSFVLDERFRIELVAAEPMIVRPVFMRFDEAGRLWVVEMPGYMRDIDGAGEDDPSGRVMVLEDRDGDGRMDHATPFLDGLVMPRTLAFVPGGVLVAEPPRIWLAKDTDGDLVADEKILLAEDYGEAGNPEHSANGLLPAIDNWMYSAKHAQRHRYQDGRLMAERTLFRGQWGISQDDTGRLFYNYNASPLHVDLVPAEYLLPRGGINLAAMRNVRGQPLAGVPIVEDKSVHPVRVTPMVTLGASDLRPDGTLKQFTAASSPFVYRGVRFPEAYRGNVFVADPVGNLVKRFRLTSDGVGLAAEPAEALREFLASTDERFRPVFLDSGPDGALYIADMYTGIIEHKRYVTEYLRKQVLGRDVGHFTETGRIYRIVPREGAAPAPVRFDRDGPAQLVRHLASPDGWVRDTAQRLLVQRNATEAVPALQAQVTGGKNPLGRLHALWTLEGLASIDLAIMRSGLEDTDARVRAAAIRISEGLPAQARATLRPQRDALAADPDARVRAQVMLTLGRDDPERAWPVMLRMLRTGSDEALATAAAAGVGGHEVAFLERLFAGERLAENRLRAVFVEQLAFAVMTRRQGADVLRLLEWTNRDGLPTWGVQAALRGAVAVAAADEPVRIDRKPALVDRLQSGGEPDLAEFAAALVDRISWPGDGRTAREDVRPLTGAEQQLFDLGRTQYALICAACHQSDGMGLTGVAPPLAGSEWVEGDPRVPTEIIIHGLAGPVEVRGQRWDMLMPGLGATPGVLDDEKIAGIVTYIRRSWGNESSPVTVDDVKRVRALSAGRTKPWTASELQALETSAQPAATSR